MGYSDSRRGYAIYSFRGLPRDSVGFRHALVRGTGTDTQSPDAETIGNIRHLVHIGLFLAPAGPRWLFRVLPVGRVSLMATESLRVKKTFRTKKYLIFSSH